ncbi:MAG: porin family protein [Acidobacteriia bacterium]|nr:porin family protein [Terriglobia bacterium]
MYRLSLILAVLSLLCLPAVAQETPKIEIFGGYSHGRVNTEVNLTSFISLGSVFSADATPRNAFAPRAAVVAYFTPTSFTVPIYMNLNGWNASVTANVNHWFGVVADFSGHYGTPTIIGIGLETHVHSFLFGPRFTYRHSERITPFVHALLGASHLNFKVPLIPVETSDSAFAMALGGGMDVKVREHVALRLAQVDYFMTRFSPYSIIESQNNIRISTGLVFRFGSR